MSSLVEKNSIYTSLSAIVGEKFVSNEPEELYIYSRDIGVMEPGRADYIVMPRTTEEVQKIVKLANKEKIPITPMGGGVTTSGLALPLKGGIVIDLKRMDKIIEVNERSRYVVIEAGVTEGQLKSYLQKNNPSLRHSMPDAPPMASVTANALIHGSGHLSQKYGFHSDMINSMEVVLPTGEIIKVGSCSISNYWFTRQPLPDLTGLFTGWYGTTGIVTKMSLKLYTQEKIKDVIIYMVPEDLVPEIWYKITEIEVAEDVASFYQPNSYGDIIYSYVCLTALSHEENEFKKKMVLDLLEKYELSYIDSDTTLGEIFKEMPLIPITQLADEMKGGGFEYVGPIMLIEQYPDCHRLLKEIAAKYNISCASAVRVIGRSHCMMFAFAFPFNRTDSDEVERVRKAIREVNERVLEMGGIPWKADIFGQKLMLKKMDPNTFKLIRKIRNLLDPNGIMNPGNLEI